MNNLIKSHPTNESYIKHQFVGILHTPMFPAEYYAGLIFYENGEWLPSYNDTRYYFRSLELANDEYDRIIKKGERSS